MKRNKLLTGMLTAIVVGSIVINATVDVNVHADAKVATSVNNDVASVSQKTIDIADQYVVVKNNQYVFEAPVNSGLSDQQITEITTKISQANNNVTDHGMTINPDTKSVVQTSDSLNDAGITVEKLEGHLLSKGTTYHNGSNYIHAYWWGYRIGLSRSLLRSASPALAFAAAFPYDKWIPIGWVISVACAAVSWGTNSIPGGIVFNYSGIPGTPYGTIWSVGWQ
ncbi:MAG: hypothetical protein LBT80_09045 [Lactobacillaceae bacterium]|jgi:hypothetical protein|nr:hypothetical protein [Lactobacillaceae bacterium]